MNFKPTPYYPLLNRGAHPHWHSICANNVYINEGRIGVFQTLIFWILTPLHL